MIKAKNKPFEIDDNKVLGQYASKGEWEDILANLPHEIRPLVEPALERASR